MVRKAPLLGAGVTVTSRGPDELLSAKLLGTTSSSNQGRFEVVTFPEPARPSLGHSLEQAHNVGNRYLDSARRGMDDWKVAGLDPAIQGFVIDVEHPRRQPA